MSEVIDTLEVYDINEVSKNFCNISVRNLRRILAEYSDYIPLKKGSRNKTLWDANAVSITKRIIELKRYGLSKDEIIVQIKKGVDYKRSVIEQQSPVPIEHHLISKIKILQSQNRSLTKTLEKKSQKVVQELDELRQDYVKSQNSVSYLNTRVSELEKKLGEINEYNRLSLFKKVYRYIFGHSKDI